MVTTRREVLAGFFAAAGATGAAAIERQGGRLGEKLDTHVHTRHAIWLVLAPTPFDSEVWVDGEKLKDVRSVVVCEVNEMTAVRLERYMSDQDWLARRGTNGRDLPREWIELAFADHDVTIEVRK